MVLGPKYADPTNNGTARAWLSDVDDHPIGALDASFQGCIRESEDGNFGVLELELGSVALTTLMVAYDQDVLGRQTVMQLVGQEAMSTLRAESWLLGPARRAMAATLKELRLGLLESLKTPAEVIPAYRRNMDHLATVLSRQGMVA